MRKQARFNYANAYNAEQGLLHYKVNPFLPQETYSGELIKLTKWCSDNYYSIAQAKTFIKKNSY